jgi:hypothetical protein
MTQMMRSLSRQQKFVCWSLTWSRYWVFNSGAVLKGITYNYYEKLRGLQQRKSLITAKKILARTRNFGCCTFCMNGYVTRKKLKVKTGCTRTAALEVVHSTVHTVVHVSDTGYR